MLKNLILRIFVISSLYKVSSEIIYTKSFRFVFFKVARVVSVKLGFMDRFIFVIR